MEKTIFSFRKFLNLKNCNSNAHALIKIVKAQTKREKEEGYVYWEFVFDLADCDRIIHLDFAVDSASDRKNGRYKIKTLREALDRFEKAYEEVCIEEENRPKRKKRI